MKLIHYTVEDFLEILASDAPAPGGGSVSALAGSLGVALTAMVANLTLGREKFKDKEQFVRGILEDSRDSMKDLLGLIDSDTEAFNKVSDVLRMPKITDEEKALRRTAMEEALKCATIVPFSIMEKSADALEDLEKAVNNTNPSALSDLGVAAHCLLTAVNGAWLNVLINLGGIKDEEFVAKYRAKGRQLLTASVSLAEKIGKQIEDQLS